MSFAMTKMVSLRRLVIVGCLPWIVLGSGSSRDAAAGEKAGATTETRLSVGEMGSLKQMVLPGAKLKSKRIESSAPFVVRIDAAFPHGTDWRYDLSFYGLEPGRYNLIDYLQTEAGEPLEESAPVWVEVYSVLPAAERTPHALKLETTPRPGRYRQWMIVGGVFWVVGLLAILLVGRRRRRELAARQQGKRTLADRLRPLVVRAQQGELDSGEQAELERLLISFWQRRLGLEAVPPAEMMARLRADEEAGGLVRQLEAWLHHPKPQAPASLEELLQPYESVMDEEEM